MTVPLRSEDEITPTVLALHEKAAAIRQGELKKAFGQLKNLSDVERHVIVALASAITDGILSQPIGRLQRDHTGEYDSVLRDLFGLDGEDASPTRLQPRAGLATAL